MPCFTSYSPAGSTNSATHTHGQAQVLSSPSCSSKTPHHPTHWPQALLFQFSPSLPPQGLFSQPAAWGPSLDHNSSLQPLFPAISLPPCLPSHTPGGGGSQRPPPFSPGWQEQRPPDLTAMPGSPGLAALKKPLSRLLPPRTYQIPPACPTPIATPRGPHLLPQRNCGSPQRRQLGPGQAPSSSPTSWHPRLFLLASPYVRGHLPSGLSHPQP